ncbi:UDP-N-acetylmuramate dehydrogenase [Arsenophonus symbiont of Ornithomya chloropus]|uniref:UDP-N-acetylmuramate dehydrogenase n=1 Tax=Arsenophonus symbiont of Ornithomya chloropus TaxID=634121 RepID=UPI0032B17D15
MYHKIYNKYNKIYNTFNLDVKAKAIYSAFSIEELLFLWGRAKSKGWPVVLLGEGSNVLFVKDFQGAIILNKITALHITESSHDWFIHVGAGNNWHELIKKLIKLGIYGLENMALIPGSVGAAPIQNIGAYGIEFKDVCHYVNIIDLNNKKKYCLNVSECQFSYRNSILKYKSHKNFAVISVGLKLKKLWKPILTYGELISLEIRKITPENIFNIICNIRKHKLPDPFVIGNAGSFFKNPIVSQIIANKIKILYPQCPTYLQLDGKVKLSAGWLIDQCNLKGYQCGGAAVDIHQAVVLINKNNAIGTDIIKLASYISKNVMKKFDIILEPEVHFIDAYGKINPMDVL